MRNNRRVPRRDHHRILVPKYSTYWYKHDDATVDACCDDCLGQSIRAALLLLFTLPFQRRPAIRRPATLITFVSSAIAKNEEHPTALISDHWGRTGSFSVGGGGVVLWSLFCCLHSLLVHHNFLRRIDCRRSRLASQRAGLGSFCHGEEANGTAVSQ